MRNPDARPIPVPLPSNPDALRLRRYGRGPGIAACPGTRADILAVKADLNADIADVRLELEKRVVSVERDTLVLKGTMGFVLARLLALLLYASEDITLR